MSSFSLQRTLQERLKDEQKPVFSNSVDKNVAKADQQRAQKGVGGKAEYKGQKQSNTIVVSFRYKDISPPSLNEKSLRSYLAKYEFSNVRIFKNKFYVDFAKVQPLEEVQQLFQQKYEKYEVFAHYDLPNQKDLNTVYLGRIKGCEKQEIEQACLQYVERIREIRIPQKQGKQCNYGYVECLSREDAAKVVSGVNGKQLGLSDNVRAVLLVE